jgi:hypothetical protein
MISEFTKGPCTRKRERNIAGATDSGTDGEEVPRVDDCPPAVVLFGMYDRRWPEDQAKAIYQAMLGRFRTLLEMIVDNQTEQTVTVLGGERPLARIQCLMGDCVAGV